MPFNQPSFIDQMTAPQAGQSQRKSVPILNTSELEIPALSFEGIGSNTVHSKETATIIAAKDVDITTVYGELRPNTKFGFEELPSLSLYAPPYENTFGEVQIFDVDKIMFYGTYNNHQGPFYPPANTLAGSLAICFGDIIVGIMNVNNGYTSGYYWAVEELSSEIIEFRFQFPENSRYFPWTPETHNTVSEFLEQYTSMINPYSLQLPLFLFDGQQE